MASNNSKHSVSTSGIEDENHLLIKSIDELRAWLRNNVQRSSSIWLVTYKKHVADWHVSYKNVVDVLLCFGWIDSLPRKLDEDRSKVRISPRSPKSNWSAINKRNVERLTQAGLMEEQGLKMVALAKENGTWDFLNDVDALVLPSELTEALSEVGAYYFNRFPDSSKRAILEWIKSAKTAETRAKRIAETAAKAALNLKANFPEGKNKGPADNRF